MHGAGASELDRTGAEPDGGSQRALAQIAAPSPSLEYTNTLCPEGITFETYTLVYTIHRSQRTLAPGELCISD